jgi:hypothetical protein
VPEKLEIAQHQGKLSTHISAYQHHAQQWLHLMEEEEDDESYSFWDTHVFLESPNSEICLCSAVQVDRNHPDADAAVEKLEHFKVALLSTLGITTCRSRPLHGTINAECELRIGQANDALQGV